MRLTELEIGRKKRVLEFEDTRIGGKLLAMGMLPGSEIVVIRKAAFGKTFYIKVNGYGMAIRKNEAACILLQ